MALRLWTGPEGSSPVGSHGFWLPTREEDDPDFYIGETSEPYQYALTALSQFKGEGYPDWLCLEVADQLQEGFGFTRREALDYTRHAQWALKERERHLGY